MDDMTFGFSELKERVISALDRVKQSGRLR